MDSLPSVYLWWLLGNKAKAVRAPCENGEAIYENELMGPWEGAWLSVGKVTGPRINRKRQIQDSSPQRQERRIKRGSDAEMVNKENPRTAGLRS